MKEREKRLIKNTTILGIGTICTKGMMFIMTPLFTRWLTQEEYGLFDLMITYIALLIPLITIEIGQAAFRFLMKEEENKEKIISNTIIVSIVGCIISIALIMLIGKFFVPIQKVIYSLVFYTIAEAFYTSLTMIIRGIKKLEIYTIANIVYVIIMALAVFIFVKQMNLGLNGIIIGYALGYFISDIYMIINLIRQKNFNIRHVDLKKIKDMTKYSLPLIPCDMAWWVMNASDRTIVSAVLGTSYNAILSIAHKIPNICQSIFGVFHLSWQESAIETMNDTDRNIYFSSVMNNMLKIITSICIVILSFSFILFKYLFTPEYFEGYYQVPILIVSIIVSMLAQFLGSLYIANMNSKKTGQTTLISAAVNIVTHIILINYIGLYAASVSTLLAYIYLFVIRYIDINKKINLSFTKESKFLILVLLYFLISSYLNNIYINYLNIVISIIIFLVINWKYILKLKR